MTRTRTPESLWRTINKSTVQRGDHLIWTGTTSQGIPKIAYSVNDNGNVCTRRAPRVVWELTHGQAPSTHYLRRKKFCTEPLCVNPAHHYLHDTTAPKPKPKPKPRATLEDRIRRRTQAGEGGCLIWTGSRDSDGYPKLILSEDGAKRQRAVHHIYWELTNGPVPEGAELARHPDCPNRRCIEPLHLTLNGSKGTAGRAATVSDTNYRCGHGKTPENTYARKDGTAECLTCCRVNNRERCRRYRQRHPEKARAYRQARSLELKAA